jgi:hypothetical protein
MATKQNLQPLLDVRQNQLGLLFASGDSINTKALAVLGLDAAVVIFILQSSVMRLGWITLVPILLFVSSLVYTIAVIWPHDYSGAGVNPEEHPEYLTMDEDDLVLQLLADTEESIRRNTVLNTQKSRNCITSIALSVAGIIVLVPYLLQHIY